MQELICVNAALDNKYCPSSVEGIFDVASFSVSDLLYDVRGPARYTGEMIAIDNGVTLTFTLKVPVTTTCIRCAESFEFDLVIDADALFTLLVEMDDEGEPYPLINDEGYIDLVTELLDCINTEAPFAPLCSDHCAGLCAQCGINLNKESCSCDEELDASHPFAGLDALLKEKV